MSNDGALNDGATIGRLANPPVSRVCTATSSSRSHRRRRDDMRGLAEHGIDAPNLGMSSLGASSLGASILGMSNDGASGMSKTEP